MDSSLARALVLPPSLVEIQFSSFCIILETNKQTNQPTNGHGGKNNLLGGGNKVFKSGKCRITSLGYSLGYMLANIEWGNRRSRTL